MLCLVVIVLLFQMAEPLLQGPILLSYLFDLFSLLPVFGYLLLELLDGFAQVADVFVWPHKEHVVR